MDVQPSGQPFIQQTVIQRQVVSQLLRARLRATAGMAISEPSLPMATPNASDLPPLHRFNPNNGNPGATPWPPAETPLP